MTASIRIITLVALAAAGIGVAADALADEGPTKITLHPAAAPTPALKHQLLPPFMDRTPGNAAVFYGKVKSEQNSYFNSKEWREKIDHWGEATLEELRREEARVTLGRDFLTAAARCEWCDWQLPVRTAPYAYILLPEAQELRSFYRLLKAHARIAMARGDLMEAIDILQESFAMGRHAAAGPTLVNGLVGIAICHNSLLDVRELVQQPGAPNLYWALTTLPQPLVDFRGGLETEALMLPLTLAEVRDLDDVQLTADEWRSRLLQVMQEVHKLEDGADWQPTEDYLDQAVARVLPHARQALIDRGADRDAVEAMAEAQVVLVDWMDRYRRHVDDLVAAWHLDDYAEAIRRIEAAEARSRLEWDDGRDVMQLVKLTPGFRATRNAQVRTQRQLAALRVIEALRMSAAAHDGRLPEQLSDIAEVPIPADPVTGQPFGYRLEGETAHLSGPPLPFASLDYEITMSAAVAGDDHSPK